MKEIYILGAGGFAKEVYGLILDIGNFSIEGFISCLLYTSPSPRD